MYQVCEWMKQVGHQVSRDYYTPSILISNWRHSVYQVVELVKCLSGMTCIFYTQALIRVLLVILLYVELYALSLSKKEYTTKMFVLYSISMETQTSQE